MNPNVEPSLTYLSRMKRFVQNLEKLIDKEISINVLIWLFPLAFILHDGEELLTVALVNMNLIPVWMGLGADTPTIQTAFGMSLLLLIIVLAVILAVQRLRKSNFLTLLLAIFYLHGFIHILNSIIAFRYTSGVVTSILIILPFCWYASRRMIREGVMKKNDWLEGKIVGVFLFVPLLMGFHQIARMVFPT